jgi:hypothetical protein
MKVKVGEDCLYQRVALQPGDQTAQTLVHYPNNKLGIEAEQKDNEVYFVFKTFSFQFPGTNNSITLRDTCMLLKWAFR